MWEGQRTKSAIDFRTFFSKEATEALKRYVEQEGKKPKMMSRYLLRETGKTNGVCSSNAIIGCC